MSSSNLEKKRVMTQQPKVPHFVRVIIQSDHLFQGKLAIPRKFMREYGSALSESVMLKVPSGMAWKVGLIKSGDEFLFGKGWDKFVQCNGIEYGHFIVFRYQGSCNFRVIIFDLSATEIVYPCNSVNKAGEGDRKRKSKIAERIVDEEEDASTEFVGEFPRSVKTNHSVPKRCIRPQKRKSNTGMKNIKEEEQDVDPEVVCKPPRTRGFKLEKRMKINAVVAQKLSTVKAEDQEGEECLLYEFRKRNGRTKAARRKKTLKKREKEKALSRARAAFKSANQSFLVVLQPAYIRKAYLPVPSSFNYLLLGKKSVGATLSSPSGRTWPVTFHSRKQWTRITCGWNAFVEGNALEVGDVCAFELIKTSEMSFKVVFFRAAEDAELSKSRKISRIVKLPCDGS